MISTNLSILFSISKDLKVPALGFHSSATGIHLQSFVGQGARSQSRVIEPMLRQPVILPN